jgi:hypothetical protein
MRWEHPEKDSPGLEAAFARLREQGAPDAPREIEQRVMEAFGKRGARPAPRFVWAFAAATAAALAIGMAVHQRTAFLPRTAAPLRAADEPFVEIPYVAPLAPYERTSIKRMEIPVSALIAAGFEIEARDTGAALRADVLFGQDGRAHAIRLVRD